MRHKGYPGKSILQSTGEKTTFDDFWDVHMGNPGSRVEFHKIRPVVSGASNVTPLRESEYDKAHNPWMLHTQKVVKRGLASTDDKSYWFDRDHCVRFGHYSILDH